MPTEERTAFRREFRHRDYRIDLLERGAFGWAESFDDATDIARAAAARYQLRHRIYWSARGGAWMIRRAYERT